MDTFELHAWRDPKAMKDLFETLNERNSQVFRVPSYSERNYTANRTPYSGPPRRVDYWTMAFGIIGALGLVIGLAVGTFLGWCLKEAVIEKGW